MAKLVAEPLFLLCAANLVRHLSLAVVEAPPAAAAATRILAVALLLLQLPPVAALLAVLMGTAASAQTGQTSTTAMGIMEAQSMGC